MTCTDLDTEAVSLAKDRVAHAWSHFAPGSSCDCFEADARELPFLDGSVDRFVSDLPFGNHSQGSSGSEKSNTGGLLAKVLRQP